MIETKGERFSERDWIWTIELGWLAKAPEAIAWVADAVIRLCERALVSGIAGGATLMRRGDEA